MNESPEWFAPKRYGYGAGLPISWQGWALTVAYIGIATVTASIFGERPFKLVAILVPTTVAFMAIAARTTRGGWRWRWGGKD